MRCLLCRALLQRTILLPSGIWYREDLAIHSSGQFSNLYYARFSVCPSLLPVPPISGRRPCRPSRPALRLPAWAPPLPSRALPSLDASPPLLTATRIPADPPPPGLSSSTAVLIPRALAPLPGAFLHMYIINFIISRLFRLRPHSSDLPTTPCLYSK